MDAFATIVGCVRYPQDGCSKLDYSTAYAYRMPTPNDTLPESSSRRGGSNATNFGTATGFGAEQSSFEKNGPGSVVSIATYGTRIAYLARSNGVYRPLRPISAGPPQRAQADGAVFVRVGLRRRRLARRRAVAGVFAAFAVGSDGGLPLRLESGGRRGCSYRGPGQHPAGPFGDGCSCPCHGVGRCGPDFSCGTAYTESAGNWLHKARQGMYRKMYLSTCKQMLLFSAPADITRII